jgi:hypothetical protein
LNIEPDVNRFYFSVLWAASPAFLVIVFLLIWDGWHRRSALMWDAPFLKALLPMLFAVYVLVVTLEVTWIANPQNRLVRSSFGTAIGRVIVAQTFVIGPVFFGSGLATWLLGWLSGYIPRNIRKER